MNLLYISSKKNWGGVTNWMHRTALGLQQKGHQVWILAHPAGRLVRSASPQLSIVPKKLGMDYNPWMVFFLRRFIRKNGVQLVLTNIEKEVIAGGLASRLCRIPNVRRVGREDDFNERLRVQWHHRLLVDRCIVPCNAVRENAVKRAPWLDKTRFTTIYNGRNPVQYSKREIHDQRARWGLSPEHIVIGVTTQLSRVKRVDRLVRVFKEIGEACSDCRLVVSGEGPEAANLAAMANGLGIEDRVVFAGFSADPMKAAAAYDIAVSSSSFEGFPNTVVEYLAAGRPVVSTDTGGVAEMVASMQNGVLVPNGDEKKLRDAILMLLSKPDLMNRLSQNALKTVEERFSEDGMLNRLEKFFSDAIQGSQSPFDEGGL